MKSLLLPLLVAPCFAMAGNVVADQTTNVTPPSSVVASEQPVTVVAPIQPVEIMKWEIKPGESLRVTLKKWCEKANYRLVWNFQGGFISQAPFESSGDFKKAVAELFAAIPQDLHLHVEITKNNLLLVSKGEK